MINDNNDFYDLLLIFIENAAFFKKIKIIKIHPKIIFKSF